MKDDEVEQAAWKSITPHRSTYTDKSGRFELKETASSNTEDAPVMKRLNFESSTFASAAKRRDKIKYLQHVEQKKPVKKSVKKSSSIRTRKPSPDCHKEMRKVHINPFRLKGGILASSMAKLWAATIIPFQVCLSTRQAEEEKKKKRKVNIRKARQVNSLKIDGIRNSKSKTTKPVFPRDVRTKYEALSIDKRINMTIPELIKSAQEAIKLTYSLT